MIISFRSLRREGSIFRRSIGGVFDSVVMLGLSLDDDGGLSLLRIYSSITSANRGMLKRDSGSMTTTALRLPQSDVPWNVAGRTAIHVMRYKRCVFPAPGAVETSSTTGCLNF